MVLPQPTGSVFVNPPNQDQYYAAEDIASNSSIGRPFFYQVVVLPCFFMHIVLLTASNLLDHAPFMPSRDILLPVFQQVRFRGIQTCNRCLNVHHRYLNALSSIDLIINRGCHVS